MHKLEIKLKQHTPLIHFQHDQDGATLRASEVKPKLDKFILKQLGGGDYEKGKAEAKAKGWLVGKGDHPALDYKLSIASSAKETDRFSKTRFEADGITPVKNDKGRIVTDKIPMFFGNMKRGDSAPNGEKRLVFTEKEIKLTFFSLRDDIIKKIDNCYCEFFAITNFGTRQSKGFGSFYPQNDVNKPLSKEEFSKYYYFTINVNDDNLIDWWHKAFDLFTKIDYFYKSLRSGINQGFYFKSLIFHYAIDCKQYYDKRKIRQFYEHFKPYKEEDKGEKNEKTERRPWTKELDDNSRLYRDMLGLSVSQSWKYYNATVIKESVLPKDEKIVRFKSPLIFKPIYLNEKSVIILVIPSKIPQKYLNQKFEVISKWDHNRDGYVFKGKNEGKPVPEDLKTPEKFDIEDFIKYVFEGDGKIIAQSQLKDKKGPIANKLIKIYNGLHSPH